MEAPIGIRTLDEWMYAIQTVIRESSVAAGEDRTALLQRVLDDMRERRAHMRQRRHNDSGY